MDAARGHRARRYGQWCERGTLLLYWLRGWDPVARNQRSGRFEMDLIVVRGKDLRLVEVKARSPRAWTRADTALGFHQRLRLQQGLRRFLERCPWPGEISFQRVSWAGWRCRFHPPERWEGFR